MRLWYICGGTDGLWFHGSKGTEGSSSPPAYLPSPVWIREQQAKERMTLKEVPKLFSRWKTYIAHPNLDTPSHPHLTRTTNLTNLIFPPLYVET